MEQNMGKLLNAEFGIYEGVGEYEFPQIEPVHEIPTIDRWIGFNYVKTTHKKKLKNTAVHFFIDDYQFERVWNQVNIYTPLLKKFSCVLSPDFSMYTDFPKAVQIYNKYRNHWLTAYWQEQGMIVIPTILWSTENHWDWQFEGYPKNSIVAVSNVGCMQDKESKEMFNAGFEEMKRRLEPELILFYCHKFDNYDGPIRYIRYLQGHQLKV